MTDGSYDCGTYSPDGRRIVASRQAPPLSEVVIIDRVTRDQQVLASADTLAFHCSEWSPLGDAVAVAVYRRDPVRANIVLLDPATGALQPVVTGTGVGNAPRWSRAGDWIVYQCSEMPSVPDDREGAAAFYRSMEICAVRPDGSDRRQLTDNDHFDAHPSW